MNSFLNDFFYSFLILIYFFIFFFKVSQVDHLTTTTVHLRLPNEQEVWPKSMNCS